MKGIPASWLRPLLVAINGAGRVSNSPLEDVIVVRPIGRNQRSTAQLIRCLDASFIND